MTFLGMTSCSLFGPEPPLPSDVTFAAHRDDVGITIDRMEGGLRGRVEDAHCNLFCSGPQFVLRSAGEVRAAFWLDGTKTTVRGGSTDTAPLLGKVDAEWEKDRAVRFSLEPESGGSFKTASFDRVGGGFAELALGQPVPFTLDTSGIYQAGVVDSRGSEVGWLRVKVATVTAPTRIYEGKLPPALSGALAAAAVARLDHVIDTMQNNSIDPYEGN